jgi:hypothetical protein
VNGSEQSRRRLALGALVLSAAVVRAGFVPISNHDARDTSGVGNGGERRTDIVYASRFAGSDFGEKVNAACAALASTGGTVDATELYGVQTVSTTINCGSDTKPVKLILPTGTLNMTNGTQILYYTSSRIIGQGYGSGAYTPGTVINDGTAHATLAYGGNPGVTAPTNVYLADFEINNTGGAGSIGLDGTYLFVSHIEDLTIYADTAVTIGGTGHCACYNIFSNIIANGTSYGTKVLKFANQNQWFGGAFWGSTGLYISGEAISGGGTNSTTSNDQFYSPDFENNSSKAVDILNSATSMIFLGGYMENSGAGILFEPGTIGNEVLAASLGITDNSGNTTNYYKVSGNANGASGAWGPTDTVADSYLFGQSIGKDYNNTAGINFDYDHNTLNTNWAGISILHGHFGHTNLTLGELIAKSGITASGLSAISPISTPTAPMITQSGTGGTTSASYYIVCHDFGGGVTLPSGAGTTVRGYAKLDSFNYNIISWLAQDGCWNWDILKGNTSTAIATSVYGSIATYTGRTITFHDTGQRTSNYVPPTRNTTGDLAVGGMAKHPIETFSAIYAGGSIPSCSMDYNHARICTSDSTACTSGKAYVSGGHTACELWCNGTNWIESGSGC